MWNRCGAKSKSHLEKPRTRASLIYWWGMTQIHTCFCSKMEGNCPHGCARAWSRCASMKPRTHARGNRSSCAMERGDFVALQWSHALTRVETIVAGLLKNQRYVASMEPRTHARGNDELAAWPLRGLSGFNGATHSRAWKPQPCGGLQR